MSDKLKQILLDIPKSEIHLHIEGLVSVDSIWALIKKNKLKFEGIENKKDLQKKFKIKSLTEFIDLFINIIQASFKEEKDLKYLIKDASSYMERNNIIYAEMFFAPTAFVKAGFDMKKVIKILDDGVKRVAVNTGRNIKFLFDVSRGFGVDNAMNNLNIVLENPVSSIIGIGLGGAEKVGPSEDFESVFKKAKENNLCVVAHAGEDVGPESVWNAIEILGVQRIGHGISSIQDEKVMKILKDRQIPLEVCPTSNFYTRTFTTDYSNHPVKEFYERGLNVTINSDDPTLFGSELIDEYIGLINHNIFTVGQTFDLIKKNWYATFLTDKEKDEYWKDALKVIKKHTK